MTTDSQLTRYNIMSGYFMIAVSILLFVWLVQYLYSRRKFYKLSWQLDGPFAWPIIGNALWFCGNSEDIFKAFLKIASSYRSPSRLWLGNRLYIFISAPKHFEIVLNNYNALEKDYTSSFLWPLIGNGLVTAPVAHWKRHRKIIMPTFNQKILNTFMNVFVEQSNILVEHLQKHVDKGYFDIFYPISNSMLDIVCETTMGIKVNAQNQECRYMKLINRALNIVSTRAVNIWYNLDCIFNLLPVSRVFNNTVKDIHDFTDAVIKQKRKEIKEKRNNIKPDGEMDDDEMKIPKRKAFLELLIELCEEGSKFTDEELRDEVNTLLIAGSDTSSGTISFVCMMLGAHPDVQEKVHEEIVKVLRENNWKITNECLSKLQYLEQVIKETLRLFPLASIMMRAFTDDVNLGSCTIPKGATAVLSVAHTHRNPDIWPQPLKFDPDRFLPETVAERHPYSYLPFSLGPRNCIGIRFAMMVMKTQLAIIIPKFVFSAHLKPQEVRLKLDLLLKPSDGYLVELKIRNQMN